MKSCFVGRRPDGMSHEDRCLMPMRCNAIPNHACSPVCKKHHAVCLQVAASTRCEWQPQPKSNYYCWCSSISQSQAHPSASGDLGCAARTSSRGRAAPKGLERGARGLGASSSSCSAAAAGDASGGGGGGSSTFHQNRMNSHEVSRCHDETIMLI